MIDIGKMIRSGEIIELGPEAFFVYSCIATYAYFSPDKQTPSVEIITKQTGMSETDVKKALAKLVLNGYLTVETAYKLTDSLPERATS